MSDNNPAETLAVGAFAIPKDGNYLRSGAEAYARAVVVSLSPFVMVSEWGDMKWSCQEQSGFVSGGPADEESKAEAFARIDRDSQRSLYDRP